MKGNLSVSYGSILFNFDPTVRNIFFIYMVNFATVRYVSGGTASYAASHLI